MVKRGQVPSPPKKTAHSPEIKKGLLTPFQRHSSHTIKKAISTYRCYPYGCWTLNVVTTPPPQKRGSHSCEIKKESIIPFPRTRAHPTGVRLRGQILPLWLPALKYGQEPPQQGELTATEQRITHPIARTRAHPTLPRKRSPNRDVTLTAASPSMWTGCPPKKEGIADLR